MKYRKLGKTGIEVPVLSFGGSSLGSVFREINIEEGIKAVHTAIDMGMNYIDTSPYYGKLKAETVLGKALKGVDRDKYILATKAGKYGDGMEFYDYSYDRIIKSCEESMKRIGVDHIDIFQLHDFEYYEGKYYKQAMTEGIEALKQLKKEGKIGHYGVTAYPVDYLENAVRDVEVDTILSHNCYSLNNQKLEEKVPLFKEKEIGIINASPLSMGLLTSRGVPDWHPCSEKEREVVRDVIEFCNSNNVRLEKLAVQFAINNPDIATTLVGSANPNRVAESIKWVDEKYEEELVKEVLKRLEPIKNIEWKMY